MEIVKENDYRKDLLKWCNHIYSHWVNMKPRFSKLFDLKSLDDWEQSCRNLLQKLEKNPEVNDEDYYAAARLYEQWIILYKESNDHKRNFDSLGREKSFSKEEAAAIALLLGIDFTKSKFDLNEFWTGVNIELEHGKINSQTNVTGDDPILTGKIALAHLNEFPDYYKRLTVLEEQAKAYWKKRNVNEK
ncbi:DUF5661 family protein [Pseudoneobacillus sp. C159]